MSKPIRHVVPAQPKCEQHGFLHTRYAERMIPAFIDPKAIDLLRNTWDTQADDIIICTHKKWAPTSPKSTSLRSCARRAF